MWGPEPLMKQGSGRLFGSGKDGLGLIRHGSLKQEKPWWGATVVSLGPYVLLVLLTAAGLAYCVLPSAKAGPGTGGLNNPGPSIKGRSWDQDQLLLAAGAEADLADAAAGAARQAAAAARVEAAVAGRRTAPRTGAAPGDAGSTRRAQLLETLETLESLKVGGDVPALRRRAVAAQALQQRQQQRQQQRERQQQGAGAAAAAQGGYGQRDLQQPHSKAAPGAEAQSPADPSTQQERWQQQQRQQEQNRAGTAGSAGAEEGELVGGQPDIPPRYSHYSCLGRKFDEDFHSNSCQFQNVCLNTESWEVEYYIPKEGMPVAYDGAGHPIFQFLQQPFLDPGHARIDDPLSWAPVVRARPFPSGPAVKWASAPVVVVAAVPVDLLANVGHVLFDVLAPIFSLMHLHRAYTYQNQVLILGAQKGTEWELDAGLRAFLNTRDPQRSLLRLLSANSALRVDEYAAAQGAAPGELLCFRRLLAGTGTLSRQMDRVDALPFRQAILGNLGVVDTPQTRPVITIFNKRGRRMVENTLEIERAVAQRYPAANVQVVSFGSHHQMSIAEQVRLLSGTSLLISPCGGLATVLQFMRPGATAIVMNYWNTVQARSVQLEEIYYRNLEYLRIEFFPVTPQDYANTRDRPECELVRGGGRPQDAPYDQLGALVHCNLRIRDMSRLLHFLDVAMMRWAAERGRYDVLPGDLRSEPS